ncbi:hypothetical protein C8D88_116106 [Lentzea atacamensis]|uniref:Uncharacterized protein n=1 Tax=Lentzea atacamensis TaxID=531938 RepID=A0A316HLV6_9PSEU|nr:hypothetical protein [Lentzea atacamensis]PWK81695.1 hypothetical protein C8D88_116106 [Lentzea atacamensis]
MGAWDPQWDISQPLQGAPEHLNRSIGVVVSRPFHHHGRNAAYVDVYREIPRVNTDTYGLCYPVEESAQQVQRAIEDTIEDLDNLIKHLTDHRDRLAAELAALPQRVFEMDVPDRTPEVPVAPIAAVPTIVDVNLPETA